MKYERSGVPPSPKTGDYRRWVRLYVPAALCLALLLGGCGPSTEEIVEREKDVTLEHAKHLVGKMSNNIEKLMLTGVKALLKDPDSAKFQDLKARQIVDENDEFAGGVLCGQVNAKNSYGGYVGFKPFFSDYDARSGEWDMTVLSDDNKTYFETMYKMYCDT